MKPTRLHAAEGVERLRATNAADHVVFPYAHDEHR